MSKYIDYEKFNKFSDKLILDKIVDIDRKSNIASLCNDGGLALMDHCRYRR